MGWYSQITGAKKVKVPMAKGNSKGNVFLHSSGRGRSRRFFSYLVLRENIEIGVRAGAATPPMRTPHLICKPKLPLDFFKQKCR